MTSLTRSVLVFAVVALHPFAVAAQTQFRGLQKDQGSNLHSSPVMGLDGRWFIDFNEGFTSYSNLLVGTDEFTRSYGSALKDTYVDGLRIGFVPPFANVPLGPLEGAAAQQAGRWMGAEGYVMSPDLGGSVRLASDQEGAAVTCVPWRVTPELGDFYLIELTAVVAEGESTRLGYFGDLGTHSPAGGLLESGLGQLVLDVTRGIGYASDQLSWTVGWDAEGGASVSGAINSDQGAELALQLGWNEDTNEFDAWIDDHRLVSGDMGTSIDVHGVGFELTGTESRVTGMLAAIPEPTSIYMGVVTFVLLLLAKRRDFASWAS